jgi:hypothetical protein
MEGEMEGEMGDGGRERWRGRAYLRGTVFGSSAAAFPAAPFSPTKYIIFPLYSAPPLTCLFFFLPAPGLYLSLSLQIPLSFVGGGGGGPGGPPPGPGGGGGGGEEVPFFARGGGGGGGGP